MSRSDQPAAQWGKLTSLSPHFENISLSKTPSVLIVSDGLVITCVSDNSSNKGECLISQENENFFVCYNGNDLSVYIEDQVLKEGEAFQIHFGEKVIFRMKNQDGIQMEYIFSADLAQTHKNILKRDRENNEEILVMEKQIKFYENMDNETKCGICQKMIYECASVVPCLHRFCIECLLLHLMGSQTCPQCGWRCVEFRKDIFLNNLIEAYEESGCQRDRSEEECREIRERLETGRIFARFEFVNGEIYEGEWKKFRKDGRGKFTYNNGDVYEGDWKNDKREGKGKMIEKDGNIYEGNWKSHVKEGQGKMFFKMGSVYEGEWRNNKREGKGKMVYYDGTVYEGDWQNHLSEGKGTMRYSSGNFYEGDWKNHRRDGKGKMVYNNGDVYEGNWENNMKNGLGKLLRSDGTIFDGNWKDDSPDQS